MGVSSSARIADLDGNQSLNRLVGNERIEEGAPFWDELLSFYFTAPENRWLTHALDYIAFLTWVGFRGDARVLEDATRNLCKRMGKIICCLLVFVYLCVNRSVVVYSTMSYSL